jgi:hypothetical protein
MEEIENLEQVEQVENNQEIDTQQDSQETQEAPAYEPNWKFKVGDEEREFDDRLKPFVQSKEDEEYFRDMLTKAHGLELNKKRTAAREQEWGQKETEFSSLRQTHDRVQNTLQKLNELKVQDFGVFQKAWEIPDQAVLRRASEILKTHDDPDARQQLDQSYNNRLQMLQYEDRVNQDTQTQVVMQRQLHEMKMHSALQSPEISRFASEYDRRMGTPGAFLEEVNILGTVEFQSKGYQDPQVIVAKAHQRLSKLLGPLEAPASAPSQAPASQPAPRPSLPNLGSGRTGTAVSRRPKSIAEIRKLAESFGS